MGTAEVKPNEAFSIRLGLVRPQSRGRIRINVCRSKRTNSCRPELPFCGGRSLGTIGALEHSRALGAAKGLSEWRRREVPRIPNGKNELNDFIARNLDSYWHPVGTCAMGLQEQAVVDPFLRVHGTENLRVVDASIMPTITSGNTNAPTVVIAERAAQLIKER